MIASGGAHDNKKYIERMDGQKWREKRKRFRFWNCLEESEVRAVRFAI